MTAQFDHLGVTGTVQRFLQSGGIGLCSTLRVHARFHVLTIGRNGVHRPGCLRPSVLLASRRWLGADPASLPVSGAPLTNVLADLTEPLRPRLLLAVKLTWRLA